ncbi:nucleotidyltransferase family protein [Celeribacter baekdonensis]|uniref:nucleotidyltransferase family protein n=1 Tax=Celeribacter baekdonensis TaxID=875171 RepID=UPI0030D722CE
MRNHPNTAMIFCAGRGTRMKALTSDRPKPMIQVAGRPLVDHALAQIGSVEHRVANLHYLPDMLKEHLNSAGIETIFEEVLLETGGGLRNALPHLKADVVFTVNTDAVWKGPMAAEILAEAWDPEKMDALLLTVPFGRTHGHLGQGDFDILPGGRLARGRGSVYTGVQILKTSALNNINETCFSLNLVWERLFQTGRIFGVEYPGHWCDVGHPEGVEIAERLLKDAN